MNAKKILESEVPIDFEDGDWCLTYTKRSQGRYRHIIALQIKPVLSDKISKILLQSMRNNPALKGLTNGKHYQFCGLSVIAFRYKEHAVLFKMFFIDQIGND